MITIGTAPTSEQKNQINGTFQSGLELVSFIQPFENEINNEDLIKLVSAAIDKLSSNELTLPIDDYHSYRDVAISFGFVFASIFENEFNWEYRYLYDGPHAGWHIVSPDSKFFIHIENIFYNHLMWNEKGARSYVDMYWKYKSGGFQNDKNEIAYLEKQS